ncbi:DUF885 domain-containing protein [Janibacter alkaliphilus]|uniref:Uncharacterized protein (DUF885 family) n=1 Tax=Janibacter alkaliphilus TaxID=1069963 RepID=A0A852WZH3_9MICO|nr:DUF885 domain-containing protein [Janibacter alkaliphilus]NYG35657.1 uncharacterized protein (DUF885 family) [Janibacter alkaliphilus]
MNAPSDGPRQQTEIDRIAEAHLDAEVALSPIEATYLGLPGGEDRLDDLSPDGLAEHSALRRRTLAALDRAAPQDEIDRVTLEAMRERLGLAEEMHAAGEDLADLNVIASPAQGIRDVFDVMPTSSDDDWRTIARRLGQVPAALEGWLASLHAGLDTGRAPARRQVDAVAQQARDLTAADGYYATLLRGASADGRALDPAVADALRHGVEAAAAAYAALPDRLRRVRAAAPERDAVGRERYQLHSRQFLGAQIDLEETYAWGQEELARIDGLMRETAERIRPGASVKEAVALLDADPRYQLHGTEALRAWMQQRADEVVDRLDGVHLDVPDPVRTIECMIAPTQTGGIYYTGPSDDFSRPGRMWWSVPKGVTTFGTWRELTTVYHEGVPGHHLQIGQAVHRRDLLNRWRRLASMTSGHAEGWALYAEWLMADLGFMDDPGDYLGLLDGQSLRAVRVVIDIGVHCGLDAPAEVGGGAWTYEKAWQMLDSYANQGTEQLRFELDRYLGWPGQAPSYKIGERIWLDLRDEARRAEGDAFSLKDFHARALDVGSVGLDTLRSALSP